MISYRSKLFLIIDVLKASFISLVPYYVLYSFILLLVQLSINFNIPVPFLSENDLYFITDFIGGMLPVLINISVAYHMSNLYYSKINTILTITLSLMVYLTIDLLKSNDSLINYTFPDSVILAMLVPLLITYMLSRLILINKKFQLKLNSSLSKNIAVSVIYIIPFALTFFITTLIFYLLGDTFNLGDSLSIFKEGSELTLLFLRTIISNFLWFLGIHGIAFFDSLVNVDILDNFIFHNLTYQEFFNFFVVYGGSGAGLSLVIAIFLASKDKHTTFVGKISLPFVFFNINEILIFGIPIFMNFSLLIPFILVPIINFIISYLFLSYLDLITFSDTFLPWITPVFVNSYLSTDGNIIAVVLQLFLIILGTSIYIPFVKKYSINQSSRMSLEKFANKLDVSISEESKRDVKFQEAQSILVKSHFKINKVIDFINQSNLLVYYQPKVDIKNAVCNDYEALIRKRNEFGKVVGPDFIIDIENSGLASIIDIWVCKEVKKDLALWAEKDFYPQISINVFPYTLEDKNYVNDIINILKGYNVVFEVIERRSSLNKKVIENINLLKKNGFKISLDDLGTGYTNFSILYELPLDSVKIDRQIISFSQTKRGLTLYNNICELCHNMGFDIILEGVETKEELNLLKNDKVQYIQGWYYSKAIPSDEVEVFSKKEFS